jgi:hypothetical protein
MNRDRHTPTVQMNPPFVTSWCPIENCIQAGERPAENLVPPG